MMSELPVDLHVTAEEAARGTETDVAVAPVRARDGVYVTVPESLRVRTPPGVSDGTTLRLPGAGHLLEDGSLGDVLVTLRVEQKHVSCELRLSPADLEHGCSAEVTVRPQVRVAVDVPPGSTDGSMLLIRGAGNRLADGTLGDLFVTLRSDARLATRQSTRRTKPAFSRERLIDLFFILLGVFGFVAGFAFPLSEVGQPVVYIDGRFFVVGFLGFATAAAMNLPSWMGPLRGRRLGIALALGAIAVAGVVFLTLALIRLMERFGYRLTL
jgi:hypothetical protein